MPWQTADFNRFRASGPTVSAWVSANAGSGKTHLLVSRVLRLLLAGVPASRILCITYTKAAAAEMQERVFKNLSEWVRLPEAELEKALRELTGPDFTPHMPTRARTLFALLADAPEDLRILTIHSFCQSVLKRFPLEAGIPPHFTVIDERTAAELLHEAAMRLFSESLQGAPRLREAVEGLAARMHEGGFHGLLKEITRERRRFQALLAEGGAEAALERVRVFLGLAPEETEASILARHFCYPEGEEQQLRACIALLLQSGKTDKARAQGMAPWFERPHHRSMLAEDYLRLFVTGEGEPVEKLCNKNALPPELCGIMAAEQARAVACREAFARLRTYQLTRSALILAETLLAEYDAMKRARAEADYDDLIAACAQLLTRPDMVPWVMYKLDGGIDHLLIDEAQDTSREQWLIARQLTGEFFAGQGRREGETRTLFVVGDEKQSIYSFQGARPELFQRERDHYRPLVDASGNAWTAGILPESFRSAAPVLNAVDAVFRTSHKLTREGEAGRVEVWPLLKAESAEKEKGAPPPLPLEYVTQEKSGHLLARAVAAQISTLLSGERLEAKGRPLRPGDIMILVRRRGALVQALLRELRHQNVPVAGSDRLALLESLPVQDLLALGEFLLQPEDDYTLAALLKCPLFSVTEEELFILAHGRGGSLFAALAQSPAHRVLHARLTALWNQADGAPPFELYAHILSTENGRRAFMARFGTAVHDVLDEFLAQCLLFEQTHAPSLRGFLHWMRAADTQIKRDMEQGQGAVRIMTVHAAKGLQAPMVILPDCAQLPPHPQKKLLWAEAGEVPLMLWALSKKEAPPEVQALKERKRAQDLEEYSRQLYVAMTRAEYRLIICGALGKNKSSEECWHDRIRQALEPIAQKIETPAGEGLLISCPQTAAVKTEEAAPPLAATVLPPFFLAPAPSEEAATRPLSPSQLFGAGEDDTAHLSPLLEAGVMARGIAVHRLLQHLPQLPEPLRAGAGMQLLHALEEAQRQPTLNEVLALLAHPDFAPFFTPESLAEVPIAGMVEMGGVTLPIAGQIDRLALCGKDVWVLDYKTTAAPPASLSRVPPRYVRQMAAYRALIAAIYPEKRVRAALLWTATLTLTELPEEMLTTIARPLTARAGSPTSIRTVKA